MRSRKNIGSWSMSYSTDPSRQTERRRYPPPPRDPPPQPRAPGRPRPRLANPHGAPSLPWLRLAKEIARLAGTSRRAARIARPSDANNGRSDAEIPTRFEHPPFLITSFQPCPPTHNSTSNPFLLPPQDLWPWQTSTQATPVALTSSFENTDASIFHGMGCK